MYVETVTSPRSECELVLESARWVSDPPEGLLLFVAWESGDDMITSVIVWETPSARGDFAAARMMPLLASGKLTAHPSRVKPVLIYTRKEFAEKLL